MKTNNLDFSLSEFEYNQLKEETSVFLLKLKDAIKSVKIKAVPFVGGSFAKKTIAQSDNYDIDIFIRFDKKYSEDELSFLLDKIISKMKIKSKKLHGSRDYIQIEKSKKLTFEVIPVISISSPKQAKNTTDLSYFHVNYVKNKIKKNKSLIKEIALAKKFLKSQKVYGAESYISGFSGYAIECLIIYYKSFQKMIKSFLTDKKIIIDPEKQHKNEDIMIELNESKTHSPIVLIDPTFKERNVLAALSNETFEKTKDAIKHYLSRPSMSFFESKQISEQELIKKAKSLKADFIKIILSTNKQAGDIAGTKLKKFSRFLISELIKYYNIIKEEFDYQLTQEAVLYLILKPKKDLIKVGPPASLKQAVLAFKKANKKTFVKNNKICAKIIIEKPKTFLNTFISKYSKQINQMDIVNIRVNN